MFSSIRTLSISKKHAVTATTLIILAGIGFLFYLTGEMPPSYLPGYPGDAFFPRLVLGFSAFFGCIAVASRLFFSPPSPLEAPGDRFTFDLVEILSVSLLSIAYMLLLEPIGFEITTTVFMFVLLVPRLIMPPARAILVAAMSAVVSMVLIYAAFVIGLKVFMPMLFLPQYINF